MATESEVIREGYLGKKNRFGVSLRWFSLTPTSLSYADKEKGREKGCIALGSVHKVDRCAVNLGQPPPGVSCLGLSSHHVAPFQVAYSVDNKTRTLHLQAVDDTDRDLWIDAIKLYLHGNKGKTWSSGVALPSKLISSVDNLNLNANSNANSSAQLNNNAVPQTPPLYHRGVWSITAKKWTCCGLPDRDCVGCEPFGNSVFHSPSSSSSSSSSPVSLPTVGIGTNGNSHARQSSASSSHSHSTALLLGSDSPPKPASILLSSRANKSPSINQLNSLNNNNGAGVTAPLSLKSLSHHNLLQGQPANLVHTGPSNHPSLIGLPPPLQKSPKFASPPPDKLVSNPRNLHNALMSSPEMASAPLTNPTATKDTGRRVVVALYPFKAIETGDLSLEKGEEYEICDDAQEHWWQVRDKNGAVGYIPSNYVKEKELLGLQKYDWYVGDMSRQRAETLLRYDDKEGCFVVRNSSTKGLYTLSLYTKVPHPQVKHYHIKQNARNEFYLSEKHCCSSIPDLINYHRHNSGGLASRLKHPPTAERCAPATAGLSHDKWEIDPSELMLHEELGSGQFGVVRRGKWRGCIDVAVKMMKEGTMSEDDFIEEAKVMTKLQHQNLVQLYGVCSKHRPIYIVTEYMKHGALLNYLRRHETNLQSNMDMLLDICTQVCKGMAYLERHNYIHRDLAARNCLVGAENVVKVADFGLARYVLDDQYTSSGGTKFPIKWAPPEVLNYTRFSSKSDVWAYGVLMWEVFTCGKMPYGRLKNTEVVERVQRGIVLEKPKNCPKEAFETMKKCWALHPDERPSFRLLKEQLVSVAQLLLVD